MFNIHISSLNDVDSRYLHDGLTFWDSNDNQRVLKPHQAKAFAFRYNKKDYHFVSYQYYLNLNKHVVKKLSTYFILKIRSGRFYALIVLYLYTTCWN